MAQEDTTINFRLPKTLKDLLTAYLALDTHMNESEFIRDAIRQKIKKEAPQLYKKLFQEKEVEAHSLLLIVAN